MTNKEQMRLTHWSDEELVNRLYGLEPGSAVHALESCDLCTSRWQNMLQRREAALAAPEISEDRLRAQRIALFERIEHPLRSWIWRAAPASAMALLLLIGIGLHLPQPPAPVQEVADGGVNDAQLFLEIASIAEQEGPAAADPLRALFTEIPPTEVK